MINIKSNRSGLIMGSIFLSLLVILSVVVYKNSVQEAIYQTNSKVNALQYEASSYLNGENNYNIIKARGLYEEILALDPENKDALYQYARVSYITGAHDKAIEATQTYKKAFPDERRIYYISGLAQAYSGDLDGAEQDFTTFIQSGLSNEAGYLDLAWIQFQKGNFVDAEVNLQKGIEMTGGDGNAWLNASLGAVLLNLDRKDEALVVLHKAQKQASEITEEIWGINYSVNNAQDYAQGIEKMKSIVDFNIKIAEGAEDLELANNILPGLQIEALSPNGMKGGYAVSACCASSMGASCKSAANSCGDQTSARINCTGDCPVSKPAERAGYNETCISNTNSCGDYNTGVKECSESGSGVACSASQPAERSYWNVVCTKSNSCGDYNSSVTDCQGVCLADDRAERENWGETCNSTPNVCGEYNTGIWECPVNLSNEGVVCSAPVVADPEWVGPDPSTICLGNLFELVRCSSDSPTGVQTTTGTGTRYGGGRFTDPATLCEGEQVLENLCGEERLITGTNTSDSCQTDVEVMTQTCEEEWQGAEDSAVCEGQLNIRFRCSETPQQEYEYSLGTKTTDDCQNTTVFPVVPEVCTGDWSIPPDTHEVCSGIDFFQAKCSDVRISTGTKSCACEQDWWPALEASDICAGASVPQKKCANIYGEEERTIVGSKDCGWDEVIKCGLPMSQTTVTEITDDEVLITSTTTVTGEESEVELLIDSDSTVITTSVPTTATLTADEETTLTVITDSTVTTVVTPAVIDLSTSSVTLISDDTVIVTLTTPEPVDMTIVSEKTQVISVDPLVVEVCDEPWEGMSPENICKGAVFTQSRCGGRETRSLFGTNTSSQCAIVPVEYSCTEAWRGPTVFDICSGEEFMQSRCSGTSSAESRTLEGVKDCTPTVVELAACQEEWQGPGAKNICLNNGFVETRCSGAANYESRISSGNKDCTEVVDDCSNDWEGLNPSEVCQGVGITHYTECGDQKYLSGTKNCSSSLSGGVEVDGVIIPLVEGEVVTSEGEVVCGESWQGLEPSEVCENVPITHYRCAENKKMLGTKNCDVVGYSLPSTNVISESIMKMQCSTDGIAWEDCDSIVKLASEQDSFYMRNWNVTNGGTCSHEINTMTPLTIGFPSLNFERIGNAYRVNISALNSSTSIFQKEIFGICGSDAFSETISVKMVNVETIEI